MSHTQDHRSFRLDTVLGRDAVLLENFEGREAISEPFRFRVRFLAPKALALDSLLGTAATLTTQIRNEAGPYFHGHWWSFRERDEIVDSLYAYEGELVPRLRFLDLHHHSRIFHNKTTREIVASVLEQRGVSSFSWDVLNEPPAREYCVQYRETDLNFLSRLLEEDGVFYYFEHTASLHRLVMSDRKQLPATPIHATAVYHPVNQHQGLPNVVLNLEACRRVAPRKVSVADYNFTTPRVDLRTELEGETPAGEFVDYPGGFIDRQGADWVARVRLEEQEALTKTISGTSVCDGFRSGHTFELKNHSTALNHEYTLLAVEHLARNASYAGDRDGRESSYQNRFEAMPAATPYRPPRRARRARVEGTQTAVVTGPEGEEIYVDEYGRVQVRFFWSGQEHSCWVRVAQVWAGKNWGGAYWPRVGQEVVVDFLEGNPDRPLIIGSVYNADQMPPFPLPANKTRSGIRSRSSSGGSSSTCNEIHFEDKKGQENFFVQAERDQELVIKHDRTVQIAHDEIIRVGHNRTSNINTTDTITAGTNVTISAGQEIKLSTPGGSLTIGPQGITLQSMGEIVIQGLMVRIN